MPQLLKNNVSGTLANELSAVGTSMTLVDASAFPDPGADYYLCTLIGLDSNGREDKWEIVRVTAKAGSTLTITRAQEGTTNRLWPAASTVQMRLTAGSVATPDDVGAKEGAIAAGSASQYWRGDKNWRDFATDVREAVLTGFSTATNAAALATDTLLVAIGKLQAQITARVVTNGALGTPSSGTLTNCTADGTSPVGFRNIPQNSKSANYTCVLADAGEHIFHPSSDTTGRTFTIPANASVAYPNGTTLTFVNQNAAGVITIAITNDVMRKLGDGTTGSRTLPANRIAVALKVAATEWLISGAD